MRTDSERSLLRRNADLIAERDAAQRARHEARQLAEDRRLELVAVREELRVLTSVHEAAFVERFGTPPAMAGRYQVTLRSVGGEIVQQAEFRPGESIVWDTHENPARVYQVDVTYLPPATP